MHVYLVSVFERTIFRMLFTLHCKKIYYMASILDRTWPFTRYDLCMTVCKSGMKNHTWKQLLRSCIFFYSVSFLGEYYLEYFWIIHRKTLLFAEFNFFLNTSKKQLPIWPIFDALHFESQHQQTLIQYFFMARKCNLIFNNNNIINVFKNSWINNNKLQLLFTVFMLF